MTAQGTLFTENTECDRVKQIDAEILNLLTGHAGGPLNMTLGDDETAVLRAIRYKRGLGNGATISDLKESTRLTERAIKEAVRGLRLNFHLPVGSSKGLGGYYLMITREDMDAWRAQAVAQLRGEVEVLRAIGGHHAWLELVSEVEKSEVRQ